MTGTAIAFDLTIAKAFGADFVRSVSEIFNDRNAALNQLSSSDWQARCAAIETLVKFWKLSPNELEQHFVRMLTDESEEVRVFAILLLAGPSFDHETCDWPKRSLDEVLQNSNATDREQSAVILGLDLRSHRRFRGGGDDLMDDTNTLLRRWETIQSQGEIKEE